MASQTEVAKHLDMSQPTVSKLVNEGVLPGGKPRIGMDLDQCRVAYINHLRSLVQGRMKAPTNADAARARLVSAQAQKAEMDLATRTGELVPRGVVILTWQKVLASVRAGVLTLPTKLANRLVNRQDPVEIEEMLRAEAEEVLGELAAAGDGVPDERGQGFDDDFDGGDEAPTETDSERVG